MTPTVSEEFVARVLEIDEVPQEIDRTARLHLLDAIGVGVAASRLGPVRDLVDARFLGNAPGGCTVLGGSTTAPSHAALVNGSLMHSLEFDDTHTGSVMHGSSVLAPVVLAAAEEHGVPGRDVMRAFALGWEVLVRIGLATPGGFQAVGFQGSAVAGPVAGVVSAGIARGFDVAGLGNAIGVAASFSAGNFTFLSSGATSKAVQAGIAAQAAWTASELAAAGVTGSSTVLEGERGFFGLYARDPDAADRFRQLVGDLGDYWRLEDSAFKGLPCCHFLQPFAEAVARLELTSQTDMPRLRCHVPVGQDAVIAKPWDRKQVLRRADEGRWSLPYVVALQAVRGAVTLEDFVGDPDPDVLAYAQRIEWQPWEGSGYPSVFPARIDATWDDGTTRTVAVDDVDGNGSRPWDRARVVAKFDDNCARAGVPPATGADVVAAVLDASEPDVPDALAALRRSHPARAAASTAASPHEPALRRFRSRA